MQSCQNGSNCNDFELRSKGKAEGGRVKRFLLFVPSPPSLNPLLTSAQLSLNRLLNMQAMGKVEMMRHWFGSDLNLSDMKFS